MPTAIAFAIRAVSILALAGLWLLASVEPSQACSCLSPGSPSESLADATEVFQGVVASVEIYDRGDGTWASNDPVTVEFDVNTVWKGALSRSFTVTTVRDGASCGFGFALGVEYIVYSYEGSTGLCSRTHEVGRAGYNDREELGQGRAPDATAATPAPSPTAAPPAPSPTAAPPAVGGCARAESGADIWWAALAVGAAWMARGRR